MRRIRTVHRSARPIPSGHNHNLYNPCPPFVLSYACDVEKVRPTCQLVYKMYQRTKCHVDGTVVVWGGDGNPCLCLKMLSGVSNLFHWLLWELLVWHSQKADVIYSCSSLRLCLGSLLFVHPLLCFLKSVFLTLWLSLWTKMGWLSRLHMQPPIIKW